MDEQPKKTTDTETTKPDKKLNRNNPLEAGKNDSEFAEEFNGSDIDSAFKNPVTGEERMY
ncbi:hypothetical protein V3851_08325 [Paenibacillus sp. M1]|uniref:Uncharacterized protein n=1 Tax=Paenibacillus haidiansis TaxID=1574488 RepID=A0ABU7VQ27_9BACL